MKNFRVTVNGNTYDVAVEELSSTQSAPTVAASAPTPASAPPAPAAVAAPPSVAASANDHKITSPMPGDILDMKVSVGDNVAVNQTVAILEAMKMENEIVTTVAGKVTAISVSKGSTVNAGDLLVSIAQ